MPPTAGPITRSLFQQNFVHSLIKSRSYVSSMHRTTIQQAGRGRLKGPDTIRINNLSLNAYFKDGLQWPSQTTSPVLQPIKLSLSITRDLSKPGKSDDLEDTLDYASLATDLADSSNNGTFGTLEELVDKLFSRSFDSFVDIQNMSVQVTKPKALLRGKAVTLYCSRSRGDLDTNDSTFALEDLEMPVIIGVDAEERIQKQVVRLNLTLSGQVSRTTMDYQSLARQVHSLVDSSSYLTIEAFASSVAHELLLAVQNEWSCITVRAAKPSALALADSAEIEITRTLSDYPPQETRVVPRQPGPLSRLPGLGFSLHVGQTLHKVAIALGSNLGDRFANIELALRLLETPRAFLESEGIGEIAELAVVDTSFLYETAPMYVTEQPEFVNCACMVETNLSPTMLLKLVKKIEVAVGRVPTIRNGPRLVDLDILLYDNEMVDTRAAAHRSSLDNLEGQLVVPHPRIAEREFVLRPLNDMIPDYIVPSVGKPISVLLDRLLVRQQTNESVMKKVIPFPKYPFKATSSHPLGSVSPFHSVPPTARYWTFPLQRKNPRKVYIMATLNATPDSFSDGSMHDTLPKAFKYATTSLANGADIIDVGGYSTRPHADYVSPADEIDRVVPVITGVRRLDDDSGDKCHPTLISVDTFRPDVAKAAVLAGANCINDVYAFTGPEYPLTESSARHFVEMRNVARELSVPVVLMHSRGEASANKDYADYEYAGSSKAVVEGVRVELGEKVDAAVKGRGGLRRWLVILDPGVGFSKTLEGNLEVLRSASEITAFSSTSGSRNTLVGYPQLIGASRKSFLGLILAKADGDHQGRITAPQERGWATAAAVACSIQQGALAVRVHDVVEMGDVTRVAAALWA